jgi:hypothetical protein
MSERLESVHLMGVYLIGMHLRDIYFVGMYSTSYVRAWVS